MRLACATSLLLGSPAGCNHGRDGFLPQGQDGCSDGKFLDLPGADDLHCGQIYVGY